MTMLMFDLDGTLGFFDGGYALLREALGEVWGSAPGAEELRLCEGSTDWEIVGQLHAMRFGGPLTEAGYLAYDQACHARFSEAFRPASGRVPTRFHGLISGMNQLQEKGFRVCLVSGNTPSVLEFKAQSLGVDPRIPRLGSLPHLDRTALIQKAMGDAPGPHLYVGDRPHDKAAADQAGVAFLGVGDRVPGTHPILAPEAEPDHLMAAIRSILMI